MKKQQKQFIILCIVLVAFCGVFFGLKAYNSHQEKKAEEEEEASKITLDVADSDEVTELSYLYDGETLTFVKEDDAWYYAADPSISINQTSITGMISNAASITADQKIESPEDTSEYGFDDPQNVIMLKTDSGTVTVTIGIYNSMTSQYYLMVSGDDNVYLADSTVYSAFQKSVEDVTEEEEETEESDDSTEETTEDSADDAADETTDETSDSSTEETTTTAE